MPRPENIPNIIKIVSKMNPSSIENGEMVELAQEDPRAYEAVLEEQASRLRSLGVAAGKQLLEVAEARGRDAITWSVNPKKAAEEEAAWLADENNGWYRVAQSMHRDADGQQLEGPVNVFDQTVSVHRKVAGAEIARAVVAAEQDGTGVPMKDILTELFRSSADFLDPDLTNLRYIPERNGGQRDVKWGQVSHELTEMSRGVCMIHPDVLARPKSLFESYQQRIVEIHYTAYLADNALASGNPDAYFATMHEYLKSPSGHRRLHSSWDANLPDVLKAAEEEVRRVRLVDVAAEPHAYEEALKLLGNSGIVHCKLAQWMLELKEEAVRLKEAKPGAADARRGVREFMSMEASRDPNFRAAWEEYTAAEDNFTSRVGFTSAQISQRFYHREFHVMFHIPDGGDVHLDTIDSSVLVHDMKLKLPSPDHFTPLVNGKIVSWRDFVESYIPYSTICLPERDYASDAPFKPMTDYERRQLIKELRDSGERLERLVGLWANSTAGDVFKRDELAARIAAAHQAQRYFGKSQKELVA